MAIITTTTLNGFASSFLTLEGETNTTVKNLLKHHKNARIVSVDCPEQNFVFTLDDGTVETVTSEVVYLRWTSSSKTVLDDLLNFKYGVIVKGVRIADYATQAYTATTKNTVKVVKTVLTASSQLKQDILSAFNARIDDLKLTVSSATTSPMLDDYLEVVKGGADLYVDGLYIDPRATNNLIAIEQLKEIIEQIESCFSGTKCEIESNVIDSKTIEVYLNNFDYSSQTAILDRLTTFKLTGKFDPDKSGSLKRLNVQILTVNL